MLDELITTNEDNSNTGAKMTDSTVMRTAKAYFGKAMICLILLLPLLPLNSCTNTDKSVQSNTIDSLRFTIDSLRFVIANLKSQLADRTSEFESAKSNSSSSTSISQTPSIAPPAAPSQADDKEVVHDDSDKQRAEWKKVRNGGQLTVKWTLKVSIAREPVWCWIGGDYKYSVNVYDCNIPVHENDIIVVSGTANGVSRNGDVSLFATKVVNKGLE